MTTTKFNKSCEKNLTPELIAMQLAVLDAGDAEMKALPQEERLRRERENVRAYNKQSLKDGISLFTSGFGMIVTLIGIVLTCIGIWHTFAIVHNAAHAAHYHLGYAFGGLAVGIPLTYLGGWLLTLPYPEFRNRKTNVDK